MTEKVVAMAPGYIGFVCDCPDKCTNVTLPREDPSEWSWALLIVHGSAVWAAIRHDVFLFMIGQAK